MENFVEGGLEFTNYIVDNHYDRIHDKTVEVLQSRRNSKADNSNSSRRRSSAPVDAASAAPPPAGASAAPPPILKKSAGPATSALHPITSASPNSSTSPRPRRQRNLLPSPERDADFFPNPPPLSRAPAARSKRESITSERILRDYERETDDRSRRLESVLGAKDLEHLARARKDSVNMSTNDYSRPRSQNRGGRYYDEDGDSDYDEHTGRRYRNASGRGYVDERDRDDYDVITEETERYRGPPANRPYDAQRQDSYRTYDNAGTVAPYDRRSRRGDDDDDRPDDRRTMVSRRSKSRSRREDRDRDYSRSRSRSHEGVRGKIEDAFDTSPRGIGIGIAGAVIGGLAGREFGNKHQKRDMLIGALVGGLGANAAENKWREWRDEKREREEDERRGQRY